MANKILTESEVATIGETTTSYANRCCTATRANELNCTVTSPSSPATNLLITGVSKKAPDAPTITGSYTTYKNVSVGTSTNPDGDIPYYGGSHRAQAIVSYEYATVTTYSNGTSTTGSYTSTSETIYGEWVEAEGVSMYQSTPRTFIGYSTPSGTVAGATRTGSLVAIYRAAYTYTPPTGCYVNISWTHVSGSQTSPAINFYNSSGTSLGSVSRLNAPCKVKMEWSGTGTVTKIGLAVNYAKYMSVTGNNGNTLLYKTSVDTYSTVTLNGSFSTSDYNNGSATIYLSFTDNY